MRVLTKKFSVLTFYLLFVILCFATLSILAAPGLEVDVLPWVQLMGPATIPFLGLGLILIGIAFRKGRKRMIWFLALICLLLAGVLAKNAGWQFLSGRTDSPGAIKIVSYNVGGFFASEKKALKAISTLKSWQPDVVCMQEFQNRALGDEQYALDYISEELSLPYRIFVRGKIHVNGVAIFSRYPIERLDTLYMFPNEINSGILATISSPNGYLGVTNFHLTSYRLSAPKHWKGRFRHLKNEFALVLRMQQKKVDRIQPILHNFKNPIIICGDFNAPPQSRIVAQFREEYYDSFIESGTGLGWTYPILGFLGLRIDYQFHTGEVKAIRFDVKKTNASDHYPILAEYVWTDKPY
jgi:endonuclease/exonuclease/phosphatase (EEP) superfamily protein YafD